MMVDRAKCDTLLGLLAGYVGELRRLAAIPAAELLADPDKVASAKYHFIVAIECCLDVASQAVARSGKAAGAAARGKPMPSRRPADRLGRGCPEISRRKKPRGPVTRKR
jgi:hypothetical protein